MNLINVQIDPNGPITQIAESELIKREGKIDNEIELTTWVEYRLKSDPDAERAVHRSVDMILKQPAVSADGAVASF